MNIFERARSFILTPSFGINKDIAIACLGILVENGKGKLSDQDIDFNSMTRQLVLCVSEKELLNNKHFATCLRLAILQAHQKTKDDPDWKQKWPMLFAERLAEVFPIDLGKTLASHAIGKFWEDARKGVDHILPSEQALKELVDSRKCIAEYAANQAPLPPRAPTYPGTATHLAPCPKCGQKKRCDQNTKRFRCSCGFNQSYPFPSAH